MRRIPPLYGRLGFRFEDRSGLWSEAEWRFATQQDRLSGGDVADHRIPPGGTPGWNVIDLRLGYDFPRLTLNGGIQNLFNEAYRIHGSGVDGYGRSGWIGARLRF
jgi:outer membrane receptor protein involved in Fe transport